MTRLNGIPIQMFATITDTRDHCGEVSQFTGATPSPCSSEFTTPESLLSIHDQVEADTISGNSHGTRNNARSVDDSRKCWWKNTASAIPRVNWAAIDTTVKTRVWVNAGANVGSAITFR